MPNMTLHLSYKINNIILMLLKCNINLGELIINHSFMIVVSTHTCMHKTICLLASYYVTIIFLQVKLDMPVSWCWYIIIAIAKMAYIYNLWLCMLTVMINAYFNCPLIYHCLIISTHSSIGGDLHDCSAMFDAWACIHG